MNPRILMPPPMSLVTAEPVHERLVEFDGILQQEG
jgi:hypothetical protein